MDSNEFERAMQRFKTLSTSQLQQICWSSSTDQDLIEFVDDLPQVRESERERSILLETVRMQSENNLNREPEIEQARAQLGKLVDECMEIRQSIQERESIISTEIMPRKFATEDSIDAVLLASAAEAEDRSENVAKSFLRGDLGSYETFLDMFLKKRKLAHLRRITADKFLERCNIFHPIKR